MKKEIKFNLKNIIIVGISIVMLSVAGSYISTSYALTENGYAIHSKNVEYLNSKNNTITDVQAAMNETASTAINIGSRVSTVETNLNTHYAKEYTIDKSVIDTAAWSVNKFNLMTLSPGYYSLQCRVTTPAFGNNVLFRLYAANGTLLDQSRDHSYDGWGHMASLNAMPNLRSSLSFYVEMRNDGSKISSFAGDTVTIDCRWVRLGDYSAEIEE